MISGDAIAIKLNLTISYLTFFANHEPACFGYETTLVASRPHL